MEYVAIKDIHFNAHGLIPAVVQEAKSGKVLMVAYMNEESLQKTVETGRTWFYSRSRKKLWNKGEESGHFQTVRAIAVDCDADTLLVTVDQIGAACHTGNKTCFYRGLEGIEKNDLYRKFIDALRPAGRNRRKTRTSYGKILYGVFTPDRY